jgi:hypothetical protein
MHVPHLCVITEAGDYGVGAMILKADGGDEGKTWIQAGGPEFTRP